MNSAAAAVWLSMGLSFATQKCNSLNMSSAINQDKKISAILSYDAEQRGQIDLMIALDNWRWMPVCQVCRMVEARPGHKKDTRLLVQKQFGKRLILVSAIDDHELIPPEADDEESEEHGAQPKEDH